MSRPDPFAWNGITWSERSREAGPEYLACQDCGAEWDPLVAVWVRRHSGGCRYVAETRRAWVQELLEEHN